MGVEAVVISRKPCGFEREQGIFDGIDAEGYVSGEERYQHLL
jgi:hypothetical protein